MSSDLYLLDDSFFRHSELNMQFFSDPFFPFEDSPSDLLHHQQFSTIPISPTPCSPNVFSASPPSQELNNLSLDQTSQLQPLPLPIPTPVPTDFSVLDPLGVKSEETYVSLDAYVSPNPSVLSYNTEKVMQRSFSSRSLDRKQGFFFQPQFDSVMEAPNFQTIAISSPENTGLMGSMRRVCSTGDLQKMKGTQLGSSPLASENSFIQESSYKARRYSPEERKQRIHRYRSKRTQRNFNKTIKYACRKTLADSRPRVRGRFARNDETGEVPKVAGFNREDEDEDELSVDGFHEEDEEAMVRGVFFHSFSPNQFVYPSF